MTDFLLLKQAERGRVARGGGVTTLVYVGPWNSDVAMITTGQTIFEPGAGLPLHTHNVEENVLILEGEATAVVGDNTLDLVAGDATWVAGGIPHRFANRGPTPMRIYWVYGGHYVTRTRMDTGITVDHLDEMVAGGLVIPKAGPTAL